MHEDKKTSTFLSKVWREAANTWPRIPLIAYGLLLAWLMLASTGSLWLSDVETNNQHLSILYVTSTFAMGAMYLFAALRPAASTRAISNTKTIICAGVLASLGSITIIAVGPYYLGAYFPHDPLNVLFYLGGIAAGIGNGILGLRLGMLYGCQPPRITLLFVGFSIGVMAFVYFSFQGSPQWGAISGAPTYIGIAVFVLLPLVTMLVAIMPAASNKTALGEAVLQRIEKPLPSGFYRLVAVGFILAIATSMMRASVIHGMAPSEVLIDNNFLMLIRIVIAAILVVASVVMGVKPLNFGKVSVGVVVIIVLAMTCSAAFANMWSSASILAYAAFFLFEVMFWCILAFVVYQKKISVMLVFGLGQGMFLVGCAVGWVLGAYAMPLIARFIQPSSFMVLVGVVVMLAALLLFNDRVFESLFSRTSEDEPSIDDMFAQQPQQTEEGNASSDHRISMGKAIEIIAIEYGISPREAEVLKLLALGRGSDFIASDLQLSRNTIRTHTHNIYLKLDVHSREEIISFVEEYRV